MDGEELRERIAAFPRWQYRFEFEDGIETPVLYAGQVNRQIERRRYFFDALLGLTGGTLAGRRVLDLGCNAGYWSLLAIEAGAEHVLGVDARQEAIDQAELVFEAKGIGGSQYRFECSNIFDWESGEHFDVVLCLGLMDVVARPLELFEIMRRATPDLIVIDTGIARTAASSFEVGAVNMATNVVDYEITLVPSRQAVIDLAAQFGYTAVALAHDVSEEPGLEDYRQLRRLAFICSESVPLDALSEAPAPGMLPWWANVTVMRDWLASLKA